MFYPPPLDVRGHDAGPGLSLVTAPQHGLWLADRDHCTVPSSVSALLYPINIVIMLDILTIVFLKLKFFLDYLFFLDVNFKQVTVAGGNEANI